MWSVQGLVIYESGWVSANGVGVIPFCAPQNGGCITFCNHLWEIMYFCAFQFPYHKKDEKAAYVFRFFDFRTFFSPSFFLLFFLLLWLFFYWVCLPVKTSMKASSRRANFSMEQPGVVAGNFALSFSLNFWAFLCISKAPFGRSLWSWHHWKYLFLLQKLSLDDANFGQNWWRQKWKKGQGSSRAVTGSTGVSGLKTSASPCCCWMIC